VKTFSERVTVALVTMIVTCVGIITYVYVRGGPLHQPQGDPFWSTGHP
jgi:hypothetical protein